jgi:hypothetical protein
MRKSVIQRSYFESMAMLIKTRIYVNKAYEGEKTNAYKILVRKHKGKRSLGRLKYRHAKNVKLTVKK